jgi:aromatic ring hydroxylase
MGRLYPPIFCSAALGIRVTGAKVVATGSALTHYTFVAHAGVLPVQDKNFGLVFLVPGSAKGVKFICRVSNEQRAAVLAVRSTIRCRGASMKTIPSL